MKSQLFPTEFDITNPDHVYQMQNALVFLGYNIEKDEIKNKIYGETTIVAVTKFAEKYCLTNACSQTTQFAERLNDVMSRYYHVMGVVKNLDNAPLNGSILQLYRKVIGSESAEMLSQIEVLSDGTYCMFFNQPIVNDQILTRFGAIIKVFSSIETIMEDPIYTTESFMVSKKETVYDIINEFLKFSFVTVFEDFTIKFNDEVPKWETTLSKNEINELSKITGLTVEQIMEYYVSYRMYIQTGSDKVLFNTFFGFLYQNYPLDRPSNLYPLQPIGLLEYLRKGTVALVPVDLFDTNFWLLYYEQLGKEINQMSYSTVIDWEKNINSLTIDLMEKYFFSSLAWSGFLASLVEDILTKKYSSTSEWEDYLNEKIETEILPITFSYQANWKTFSSELAKVIIDAVYKTTASLNTYITHKTSEKIISDFNSDKLWLEFTTKFANDITNKLFTSDANWKTYLDTLSDKLLNSIVFIDVENQRTILTNALNNYIIPFADFEIEDILDELKNLKNNFQMEKPLLIGDASVSSLFNIASTTLTDSQKSEISTLFFDLNADLVEFEKALLDKEKEYGTDNVKKTVITFGLGHITDNHTPMLEYAKKNIVKLDDINSVRDLAKVSKDDWIDSIHELISEGKQGYPLDTPGRTEDEKINNYADTLVGNSEKTYPDVSYIAGADRSGQHGLKYFDTIKGFIYDNPDKFDLLVDSVDDKFIPKGSDEEKEVQINEFKAVQSAFRLSPTPQCATALLDAKIHSASQLYFTGKDNIESILTSNGISKDEANKVFQLATSRYAGSLAAFTSIRSDFSKGEPRAIMPTIDLVLLKELKRDFPNIETLFGSTDYCNCEHCASVYSPSAYLLDVLTYLNGLKSLKDNGSGYKFNVREILKERRPDIENIQLNCSNADTAMPYIDLVNEILENKVAGVAASNSDQTTLTSKELLAAPEHLNDAAYRKLKKALYPIYSSYDLYRQETRGFLEKSGVKRYALVEAFQKPLAGVSNADIAAEYFELTDVEKNFILTTDIAFPDESGNYSVLANRNLAAWNADISLDSVYTMSAEEFIKKTGLDCHEMYDLMKNIKWVGLSILGGLDANCSCDNKTVTGNANQYDRAHRFVRLFRKTPFEMWELDLLLSNAIINPVVSDDSINLINLMNFDKIKTRLKLKTEQLIAFYGNIDTHIRFDFSLKSILPMYDRLFLSKSVSNPLDPNMELDDNRQFKVLAHANPPSPIILEDVRNTLMCALQIDDETFDLLVAQLPTNERTFENIAKMYRWAKFAKVLKIKVKELFTWISVMQDTIPADFSEIFASVENTNLFLNDFDTLKKLKLSANSLYYLLNYGYGDTDFTPDAKQQQSTLELFIDELSQLCNDVIWKYNTSDDLVNENPKLKYVLSKRFLSYFSQFNNSTEFLKVNDIIEYTNLYLPDDEAKTEFIKTHFNGFISDTSAACDFLVSPQTQVDRNNYILSFLLPFACKKDLSEFDSFKEDEAMTAILNLIHGIWEEKEEKRVEFIQKHFSNIWDGDVTAINTLVATLTKSSSVGISDIITRSELILVFLYKFEKNTELIATVQKTVCKQFDISMEISSFLFSKFSITDILTSDLFIKIHEKIVADNSNIPDDVYKCYYLLSKSCLLINSTKMTDAEAEWHIGQYYNHGGFNWSTFKLISADSKQIKASDMRRISDIISINKSYPAITTDNDYSYNDVSIYDVLMSANSGVATQLFAKLTSFSETDVDDILVNLSLTSAVGEPETYLRIINCVYFAATINCKISEIFSWTTIEAEDSGVKAGVKARYSDDAWLEVVRPIQKPIRESKCNALCSFLIEDSQRNADYSATWYTKNDLYFYFLIDPEMTACQLTSRIKLAMSSVQLFVQRCFLNLEPSVITEGNNTWNQWTWMKNYRVWEANRKVFLYPENWIEPDLRDDKTPFFKDLEDELNGGDITKDLAEDVYQNYLQKLNDVSKLNVCGLYHETDTDTNLLHVIARTSSSPHIYYYRVFNGNYGSWSAWEKIEIEIKGEIVVPIVYNRKLHLFWLLDVEKSVKGNNISDPHDGPYNYHEIQLCWSVLKKGKWSAPKIGQKRILCNHLMESEYKHLVLTTHITSDNILHLWLYNDNNTTNNGIDDYYVPGAFDFDGDVINTTIFYVGNDSLWTKMTEKMDPLTIPDRSTTSHIDYSSISRKVRFYNNSMHQKHYYISADHNYDNSGSVRILKDETDLTILGVGSYLNSRKISIMATTQDAQSLNTAMNSNFQSCQFFINDSGRVFSIQPEIGNNNTTLQFNITPFYHPYSKLFIRELNRYGVKGILNRDIQVHPETIAPENHFDFNAKYNPQNGAYTSNNTEIVDFAFGGAYSVYNWELFFHAPLYIACKLSENQKFEDSMNWFHSIFNPMDTSTSSGTQKFWVTKPFYQLSADEVRAENITNILNNIGQYADQVKAWLENPFMPHLIARYRPVAYQRTVVMKYIDNLIAWADQLFRRDTIESINEATLLYILASEILGDRPQKMPAKKNPEFGKTFTDILAESTHAIIGLDPVSVFESNVSYNFEDNHSGSTMQTLNSAVRNTTMKAISKADVNKCSVQGRKIAVSLRASETQLPRIDATHFCIPFNDQLLTYWDTVEDRLYKIRHCMNIEGVERQLALFEPPIDPALLVRAAAMGLDIASVLADSSASMPNYRFRTVAQKAMEFCGEVKQLGEKILSTIEKRDAESLALLRSSQEINMQQAAKQVRKMQITEAEENMNAQNEAIKMAQQKYDYYSGREFMSKLEGSAYDLSMTSAVMNDVIAAGYLTAAVCSVIPGVKVGVAGLGPFASVETVDGNKVSRTMTLALNAVQTISQSLDKHASMLATKGSYQRRQQDWDFQVTQATQEIAQLKKQSAAAEIRKQIAEKELENQDLQIEQLKTTDEYYTSKFTNEELYNWMLKQVTSFYFKSYQLAYDMAKKAEACYRYELGIADSNYFINFGYWDNAKKGLLAGDKLMYDLHRMDAAYIDNNKRSMELTKHISLAQMFPQNLIDIINSGSTFITLPEWLFDMDYPGHYMRRIKSVSISIPNISGPYTGVNCTLTLLNNMVRTSNLKGETYVSSGNEDNRFTKQFGAIQSIATSHGQNDAGVFEMNFNDERYLPFEGAGVISDWKISLPKETNMFNFNSLSDVIIHVNYTSRDGGSVLGEAATAALKAMLPPNAAVLLSLKHDFPAEWNQLLSNTNHEMTFELKSEHLPYFANLNGVKNLFNVIALTNKGILSSIQFTRSAASTGTLTSTMNNGVYTASSSITPVISIGEWKLTFSLQSGAISDLDDVLFAVMLSNTPPTNG